MKRRNYVIGDLVFYYHSDHGTLGGCVKGIYKYKLLVEFAPDDRRFVGKNKVWFQSNY